MAQQLVALGIDNTMPDALGAYQQGVQANQTEQHNQIANATQTAELLGSGALYAMGGKLDGEVDPAKYNEVLDSFQNMGLDVGKYRGNPNYAKVFANASVSFLDRAKLARDDRDFAFSLKKFDEDIRQFDASQGLKQQEIGVEQQRLAAANTPRTPTGYEWAADGTLKFIPGGPADPENPRNKKVNLTEGQAKTAGYANRMIKAETEVSSAPDSDPTVASANPLSGDFWTMLNRKYGPNMTQSPEYQEYANAASEWIRAKLRKESGAAISASEWDSEFKTYFPQPGDSKEVAAQKARLRVNAVESMKAESRGGYKALFEDGGQGVGAREIDVTTPSDEDQYDIQEVQ